MALDLLLSLVRRRPGLVTLRQTFALGGQSHHRPAHELGFPLRL